MQGLKPQCITHCNITIEPKYVFSDLKTVDRLMGTMVANQGIMHSFEEVEELLLCPFWMNLHGMTNQIQIMVGELRSSSWV